MCFCTISTAVFHRVMYILLLLYLLMPWLPFIFFLGVGQSTYLFSLLRTCIHYTPTFLMQFLGIVCAGASVSSSPPPSIECVQCYQCLMLAKLCALFKFVCICKRRYLWNLGWTVKQQISSRVSRAWIEVEDQNRIEMIDEKTGLIQWW